MRVRVKVCGITNLADAMACVEAGADALGFIFFEKSPRFISPSRAKEVIAGLPPFVSAVGVFVNEKPETVREIVDTCGLDLVQLHGDEGPDMCRLFIGKAIKAFRVRDEEVLEQIERFAPSVKAILLDAWSRKGYGGTGETFDWGLARKVVQISQVPVILAGGLNCDNISDAVEQVSPYGVDVSSGLERVPGEKDHFLVRKFFEKIKR